jgi:hypothetical protein
MTKPETCDHNFVSYFLELLADPEIYCVPASKPSQHRIAEVPRRPGQVEMTIGRPWRCLDHYRALNEKREADDRG